jgi:hypothetical protein
MKSPETLDERSGQSALFGVRTVTAVRGAGWVGQ